MSAEGLVPGRMWAAALTVAQSARRQPRRALLAAGGAALLLWLAVRLAGGSLPPGVVLAEARGGPFRVTLVEGGTLQALRSVTYASTIQSNQAKIVALAPEGRMVQKGDLLVLFDSAPFEEEIRRNSALLGQAEAELEKARQDLRLQTIQNEEDLAAWQQKVQRSELELKDVEEGTGRVAQDEAHLAVGAAERELRRAESSLDALRPMLKEGFITRQELEKAEQAVDQAREELALAQRKYDSLVRYGRPLELSQAKSGATLTRESLRQTRLAAASRIEQKRAEIASAESKIQEASSRLALARQQLARTEVRADVPGIVVYRPVFFGSEQRKPQVGDQVWANQPLLILPDVSRMVVETRVRETDVHRVARNQHAVIRVQAYPEARLTGRVDALGTLAEEEKDRRGTKYFHITVLVEQSDPRLRPGMTAQVEIQVEERASAVSVPLDAVFQRDGGSVCFVAEGGSLLPRPVVLGPSNRDFVVIESGVAAGERVALRDPASPDSPLDAPPRP